MFALIDEEWYDPSWDYFNPKYGMYADARYCDHNVFTLDGGRHWECIAPPTGSDWVYVLQGDGLHYVGSSGDGANRCADHFLGRVPATHKIIASAKGTIMEWHECESREEAYAEEREMYDYLLAEGYTLTNPSRPRGSYCRV